MGSASLIFSLETAHAVRDEIVPLLAENWKAVRDSYPESKLRPNFALYLALEDNDTLRVFTARMNGILVGYVVVVLVQHPHRIDDRVGTVDTMFILPEFRFGGTALRLLRFVEKTLKDNGTCSLTMVAHSQLIERWLRQVGYRQTETVWERAL